ncbi:MAG: ATP-binding protein [Thermodesulfovibrionales bacterium]
MHTAVRKYPWRMVALFIVLAAANIVVGYLLYTDEKEHIKREIQKDLTAVADLKAREIIAWRSERIGDAEHILDTTPVVRQVREWLQHPGLPETGRHLLSWMSSLQRHYGYESVFLLDARGVYRIASPANGAADGPEDRKIAEEALKTGKILFADLHDNGSEQGVRLTLAIPLLPLEGGGHRDRPDSAGVLFLRMDPYRFLYPLIQSWPTSSSTAEILLLRSEGDQVVFLNELRHRKGTALRLRLPLSGERLPAAKVVLGEEGVMEGIDYRGVKVLAALRRVAGSPWHIVAKVDEKEVYASLHEHLRIIVLLAVASLLAAGAGVSLLWRRQTEKQLRTMNRKLEKRVLEEMEKRLQQERLLVQQSKMAAMGEMISAIAHQWRQPLNTLGLIIQDIKSASDFGELTGGYIDTSVRDSMREIQFMSRTIDDFRNFFKPSKEKSFFALTEAVEEVLHLLSAQLKNQNISVRLDRTPLQSLLVSGYPNEFKQAVLNILTNAKDAILERRQQGGPESGGGDIRIAVSSGEGGCRIRIRDNGGGIPEEIRDRIFDPYFTTKEQGKGTGIGLYMTKMIIESNMGGRLTAENAAEGAEFSIEFPAESVRGG